MIPLNLAELTTVSRAQNNILKNDTHVGTAFSQPGSRRPSEYKKIPPNVKRSLILRSLSAQPVDADPSRPGWTACVSAHSLSPRLLAIFGKTTFYAFTRTARRGQPNHYIMELSTTENKIPFDRPNIWRSAMHTRKKKSPPGMLSINSLQRVPAYE